MWYRWSGGLLLKKSLLWLFLLGWFLLSVVSINHLYHFSDFFSNLPTFILGWLGWGTALFALVFLGRHHLIPLLGIVLVSFILGYSCGPFLSPAADPVEHLRRVYETNCNNVSSQISRENAGFWQYSMAGVILCSGDSPIHPEKTLLRIDIANGLFWALMAGALFILGIQAGLAPKWSILSVLICFLFFGTNRISYVRYYSFAPSSSSIIVYWLWTAAFFFSKKRHDMLVGLVVALCALSVLWVNHRQEGVFLGFIVLIWCILNICYTLNTSPSFLTTQNKVRIHGLNKFFSLKGAGLFVVCVTLLVLPHFDFFREFLRHFFLCHYGSSDKLFFLGWKELFTGKQADALRVKDTLGLAGIFMLLLAVPYLWGQWGRGMSERRVRIYILAILPFIGYFIPFFHFVWTANIKFATYYRLCYTSMFWILFADSLSCLETRFYSTASRSKK